jgi:hypothetical protein
MDAAEILDQLIHAEGLPKAALQAASAQRAEMVPVFLHEIDSYLALDSTDRGEADSFEPSFSGRNRGENVVVCRPDGRGFWTNCPAVGCVSQPH